MKSDLFLSYARIKDLYNGVSEFKNHLEWEFRLQTGNKDFTVFQDKNEILVGEEFDEVIKNGLSNSKALIILYSPTWINSDFCKKEYTFFKKVNPNRPIILLLWGKVDLDSLKDKASIKIHKELSKLNYFEWDIDLQYGKWKSPELKIAAHELVIKILMRLKKET